MNHKQLKQYIIETTDISFQENKIVFKTKEKELNRLAHINFGHKPTSKKNKTYLEKAIKLLK